MVEFIVLENLVLGDRFLNGFAVKMANRVADPGRRLNNMMVAASLQCTNTGPSVTMMLISAQEESKSVICSMKLLHHGDAQCVLLSSFII